MEPTPFKTYLREQLERHGFALEEFSAKTGVSERHLEALLEGHYAKLPAAPYVRGYLINIAHALDLKEDELWELYKKEVEIKSSGPKDRLPENRYAIKTIKRSWIWGGAAGLVLLIIIIANIGRVVGEPSFTLVNPALETTTVHDPTIVLQGTVDPGDKLTIDGVETPVSEQGVFEYAYPLDPGTNQIAFTIKKFLGKEITVRRQVIYEPVEQPLEISH